MGLNPAVLKAALGLLALSLAGYIVGPPLYWHFMEGLAAVSTHSSSCPACTCDCSSQPLLSIPQGISFLLFCSFIVLNLINFTRPWVFVLSINLFRSAKFSSKLNWLWLWLLSSFVLQPKWQPNNYPKN